MTQTGSETMNMAANDGESAECISALLVIARLLGDPVPMEMDEAREILDLLSRVDPGTFARFAGDAEEFRNAWTTEADAVTGTGIPLHMEESFYKPWTTDPSHPLRGTTGLVMGDPAAHMTHLLETFGLTLRDHNGRTPDHVTILLEFLVFLLETRPMEEARTFCRDHLDWLRDLEGHLVEQEAGRVLGPLARTARNLVSTLISDR